MVAKQNLTVYQGSDFRRVMELKNELEQLINLTGYVFRGQAKTSYAVNDAAFSIEFIIRNQVAETGLVDFHITSASTALLPLQKATKYLFDIEMVEPLGDVKRILEGEIQVFPEVTK